MDTNISGFIVSSYIVNVFVKMTLVHYLVHSFIRKWIVGGREKHALKISRQLKQSIVQLRSQKDWVREGCGRKYVKE